MSSDSADIVHLMTAYISVWNERDPQVRRAIGAEIFTPQAVYVDPTTSVEGRTSIDAYVGRWQQQFTDMVFHLGEVRGHHNLAHFSWNFGPPNGPPAAHGWDVVVLEHGKIGSVYGFFG